MALVGPVFWYDLVRVARRQRQSLWRVAYGAGFLIALTITYVSAFSADAIFSAPTIKHARFADVAAFANQAFAGFAAVQLLAVVLITPGLTATALAEERSRHTLTFLLTSQLSSREIILGKLLTRLLTIAMLIFTGLPMFGILQLFGGVDQFLVLGAFGATLATALSLGSLGIAMAVIVKHPHRAALRAYQVIAVFGLLSCLCVWLFDLPLSKRIITARPPLLIRTINGGMRWVPGPAFPIPPLSTDQFAMEAINWGNPYFAALRLQYELSNDGRVPEVVAEVVGEYCLVHLAFAAMCVGWSIIRLRAVSASRIAGLASKKSIVLKPVKHPAMSDRPVLWKELHCEARPRRRWLAMMCSKWFFVASFLPIWIMLVISVGESDYRSFAKLILDACQIVGTLVVLGLLARLGIQAARAIGGERDRETLDSLLTTELSPREIINDKWRGILLSGRWVLMWLVVHWLIAALSMAVDCYCLPLLIAETLAFAAFIVSLGLLLSVTAATTKQAVIRTLSYALLIPFLFGFLVRWIIRIGAVDPNWTYRRNAPNRIVLFGMPTESIQESFLVAMSPAEMLFNSATPSNFRRWFDWPDDIWMYEIATPAMISVVLFSLASAAMLLAARIRFHRKYFLRNQGVVPGA